MLQILIFLHVSAAVLAVGTAIAGLVAARHGYAGAAPEAVAIRRLAAALARISSGGLLVLLLTGPVLVAQLGGLGAMPAWFFAKLGFVIVAVGAVLLQYVTPAHVFFTLLAGVFSAGAMFSAVIAFK